MALLVLALWTPGAASTGPAGGARTGGTLRIGVVGVQSLDPAISYEIGGSQVLSATCAHLMTYPDKPLPEGLRVVPEVAAAYPRVSRGGRQFTFTLRRGFRFSNGRPVTAAAFARAINRLLTPAVESPGAQYAREIVGADAVMAGRARSASGVVARGYRLIVRFTKPVPDFPARTTMHFFCAVPPNLPADPEGLGVIPAAGPYRVTSFIRGRRVTLNRNRFYRGRRPHHVDRIVVDLSASGPGELVDRVASGRLDSVWVPATSYFERFATLKRRYGINRSRFFVKPGLFLRGFALNTSRPLFRNNAPLRRAVNYAVDRSALLRERGTGAGTLTDQYLPPSLPGAPKQHVYPLRGPNLRRARALASGHR